MQLNFKVYLRDILFQLVLNMKNCTELLIGISKTSQNNFNFENWNEQLECSQSESTTVKTL